MDAQTQMQIVEELFNRIATAVGALTREGVYTFEEGMRIIKTNSDKQTEWMQNNFSDIEVYHCMNRCL